MYRAAMDVEEEENGEEEEDEEKVNELLVSRRRRHTSSSPSSSHSSSPTHHSRPHARQRSADRRRPIGDAGDVSECSGDDSSDGFTLHTNTNTSEDSWAAFYAYLPFILSGWLQLILNATLVGFVIYVVYTFVDSVQTDVATKVGEFSTDILNEMSVCSSHYRENKCEHPLPAMVALCRTWETCLKRDPASVARTKLSAQTLGEIVNGFVEPLSTKTIVFFTVFLFGFWIISNYALEYSRSKMLHHHPPTHTLPHTQQQPPNPHALYISPSPSKRRLRSPSLRRTRSNIVQ